MDNIASKLLGGDRRALARSISLIENEDPQKYSILKEIYPHIKPSFIVGFTGSPGSGKSTLVDRLISMVRQEGMSVGVLAVDPSSPFTGGALLGDRIRMQEHTLDKEVFIRSMGTRGTLGGLSKATREATKVLEAYGKDLIILETVGVGQSEVDIARYADTTVLVLTPAGGDSVQTIKAGVMEIADIFVVNKSDLPGTDRTCTELEAMLDLGDSREWRPPVIKTTGFKGEGMKELKESIEKHKKHLHENGYIEEIRRDRIHRELEEQVEYLLKKKAWDIINKEIDFSVEIDTIVERNSDPYTSAQKLIERYVFNEFIKEE